MIRVHLLQTKQQFSKHTLSHITVSHFLRLSSPEATTINHFTWFLWNCFHISKEHVYTGIIIFFSMTFNSRRWQFSLFSPNALTTYVRKHFPSSSFQHDHDLIVLDSVFTRIWFCKCYSQWSHRVTMLLMLVSCCTTFLFFLEWITVFSPRKLVFVIQRLDSIFDVWLLTAFNLHPSFLSTVHLGKQDKTCVGLSLQELMEISKSAASCPCLGNSPPRWIYPLTTIKAPNHA